MYDVLRDNIGLLLQPINEFSFPWSKKPTRWQRFKNFVGRNKGKIAAGAGMLGAGALGGDYALYRRGRQKTMDAAKTSSDKDYFDIDEKNYTITSKEGHPTIPKGQKFTFTYRPFGLGNELHIYDAQGKKLETDSRSVDRKLMLKDLLS